MKQDASLRALLICADDATAERVLAFLPENVAPVRSESAPASMPVLERGDAELVIAAEPFLQDVDGSLLPTLLREERICLLLLTETDAPRPLLTERGALVLPCTCPDFLLQQAVLLLVATRLRLRKLESRAARLEAHVEDMRLINRAKLLLVQQLKMTEAEAHRYIEKQAMDTCRKRRTIAESIIRTYEA